MTVRPSTNPVSWLQIEPFGPQSAKEVCYFQAILPKFFVFQLGFEIHSVIIHMATNLVWCFCVIQKEIYIICNINQGCVIKAKTRLNPPKLTGSFWKSSAVFVVSVSAFEMPALVVRTAIPSTFKLACHPVSSPSLATEMISTWYLSSEMEAIYKTEVSRLPHT